MQHVIFLILFLFSLPTFSHTTNCQNDKKEQVVIAVCDGDTIVVEKGNCKTGFPENKIRLLGIDAFEMGQEPYGKRGKDFLTKLLLNKKVCIETDVDKKDIYDRTLGYVFLKNVIARSGATKQSANVSRNEIASLTLAMTNKLPLFINEEILKTGHAILYDFPPNTKYINRLKKAQIYARKNMIGIWGKENYIKETPAQWRHKNKRAMSKH